MSELVKVSFHGQEIDCVRDERGVWVSLRRICENVGVDADSQRTKLESKHWASTVLITVQLPESGQRREMTMLHLESLPMWLATIDAERVAEHVRPKIELYQRECAKALRDYWFNGEAKRETQSKQSAANETKLLTAKRLADKERRLNGEFLLRTLKTINEATPLDPGVFAATAAAAAETVLGRALPALKPPTSIEWFTPTQIAEQLGCTANRVGLIVSELGIRGNHEGVARAVLSKASHSDKTVTTYQYTPKAVSLIAQRLAPVPEEAS